MFYSVILLVELNVWVALSTIIMVVAYTWFTFAITRWRIAFRREMNQSDTDANTKAVDSLLNFETVKYFNNEKHETRRFDVSMEKYLPRLDPVADFAVRSSIPARPRSWRWAWAR